jgi:uncharacterized protein (DUF305 family)
MGHILKGVLAVTAVAAAISLAFAQETDASKAYMTAMHDSMDMDMKMSGDPDVDFIKLMIPHHQGALDMAKIELKYGKDAEVKKKAEEIIKAQEEEIAWMKAWLKKHGN